MLAAATIESTSPGEIQVSVPEVSALFNAMDPSPLRHRDLDPAVEEFVLAWGRELSRKTPLTLDVRVEANPSDLEVGEVVTGVHAFFARHATASEQRLRQLFRVGRTSLAIGLVFLVVSTIASQFVFSAWGDGGFGGASGRALEIGGWVAMWRPLSIFLYDWWPIAADVRLFQRLAGMPVRIVSAPPLQALPGGQNRAVLGV